MYFMLPGGKTHLILILWWCFSDNHVSETLLSGYFVDRVSENVKSENSLTLRPEKVALGTGKCKCYYIIKHALS